MERSNGRRSIVVVASLGLVGCVPSVGGLVAAGSDGGGSQIVNPTIAVTAPPPHVGSTSLQLAATTTPAGQSIEGNLDDSGWRGVSSPWSLTGLAEGPHTAKLRVAGAPGSERTVTWIVDTVPPSTPTGFTIVADKAGELALSWTAATDAGSGIGEYTIDYGTTSGAPNTDATAAAEATSARLTDLSACATYYLTLRAVDRAGNASVATAEVSARARCGGDGHFTSSSVALTSSVDAVARGDFDGDGILDVVVSDADRVRVLLGNGSEGRGDGTFALGQELSLGSWVAAVAVADLDADRIEDLAVLNATQLRIYRGQGSNGRGDGTFGLQATITTNLATPQALLVRDLDSDRIPDLVVGDWAGDRLVVFTGNGTGGRGNATFTYANQVSTGSAPGAIVSGDFNADGIADLAVACQSGAEVLVTHLGNGSGGRGDGTFGAMQTWLSGGFVAGDVLVSDMNGDRIDDLIVTLALANAVCFMAGSGSGGIGTGTFYLDEVVGVGARPWGLVAGDFTGDNIVDYASLSYLQDGVTLITANGDHGRGDGTFATTNVGGEFARLFHGVSGDVDGNGSPDMVVGDLDGRVLVLASDGRTGVGDGTFARRDGEPTAIHTAHGVGAQDIDSDQVPDVMVASFQQPYGGGSDFVLQYANVASNGLGTGSLPSAQLLFVGSGPTAFAFGDFQRDGITDIAVLASDLDLRGGGNRVDILIGAGSNGVGTGGVAANSNVAVGTTPRGIVAGDFNADAIVDLAVTNAGSNTVTILLGGGSGGRGDATFAAAGPFAAGTTPFPLVVGDFDSNGITDLAVGTAPGGGGELRILIGQGSDGLGNGNFVAGASVVTSHDVTGLVAGDFTGDGILDLIGTQYRQGGGSSGSGMILFTGNGSGGRGDGTFTAGPEIATGTNAFAVAAADFDHDGILDLAVTDADGPTLAILLGGGSDGRGDGTFATPAAVALAAASVAIAVADLDSDGIVDLVSVGGDRVSVCFGGGSH